MGAEGVVLLDIIIQMLAAAAVVEVEVVDMAQEVVAQEVAMLEQAILVQVQLF